MDVSDIVEEDEEALLKGFLDIRRTHVVKDDSASLHNDKVELPKSDVNEDQRKDYSHDVLPMNESTGYFPLDQQDWENRIICDSPPVSETCDGSELSGPESDSWNEGLMPQTPVDLIPDEEDHGLFCLKRFVFVEPFGSRNDPKSYSSGEESVYHPQCLRLESRLGTDNTVESKTIKRFHKLTLQNKDVLDGSWTERIVWHPHQSVPKSKLIYNLQDEQMFFEVLNDNDGGCLARDLHAGAMITTHSAGSAGGDFLEVHVYGGQSGGGFDITNDKFYSNRNLSQQQLKSHFKVVHSIPALTLQTMKAKLSNKDIAYFHRPKALWYPHENAVAVEEQGNLLLKGSMKIILKILGGKACKFHVDAEETILSVIGKATKKLDFKLSEPVKIIYSGKELEDGKSLSEQNVRPNSVLRLVRTRIHLLPRAQKLPENKSLRPHGAFKHKSDLSATCGHVYLMEYCEERPLLLGNTGMGARLCTYYQNVAHGDQAGAQLHSGPNNLGNVLTLDPGDKSPFLGDIKAGSTQSSLETNMYRAPIYRHKVSSTDYLLIRSAKGKLSLRQIDRIYVVGQQEPHMKVMSPVSKGLQAYHMNRLLVFMYREFRACQKRGLVPAICASELSALSENVAEVPLRKKLKSFCYFQRGSWVMKQNFSIPLEEKLRKMVQPEDVCLYESMRAGMYRLKRLGISMTHLAGISSAMKQLPEEAIALAAVSHIKRELQITPWNLSSNFVECTNQDRGNIESLEITGVGDPSGRGLGFSYVRTASKGPMSNAIAKKKVPINRGGTTLSGTDADLRRLSMKEAHEVLIEFNVPEDQIAKLTRAKRMEMIRKLSSEQAASGVKVDLTTISKYARGQRMSFLQLQQQTKEKCQEIWDRQSKNLSAIGDEDNGSDTEANSDLDSFAGDLENLLDAEEGADGDKGNYELNHENLVGVKGIKMRRLPSQAQAEVENEDEAAEAEELRRMLMDVDDEAECKKKKVKAGGDMGLVCISKNKERLKTINTTMKPMSDITRPDGPFSIKESGLKLLKDDELFPFRKNFSGKMKTKKKDDFEEVGLLNKTLRILNDGMSIMKDGNPKKNAREIFTCGACGQYGHMKTNKQCPKYRENSNSQIESIDREKAPSKSINLDSVPKPPQKNTAKMLIQKGTKLAVVERSPDDERNSLKAKVLKVKCGPANSNVVPEKATPSTSQVSERPVTSDTETINRSSVKVNKTIFSNQMKTDNVQSESHKPLSLMIRPPSESNCNQNPPRKVIVNRRPKEVYDLDHVSQEISPGNEPRTTKRMTTLSGNQKHRDNVSEHFVEGGKANRDKDSNWPWEEQSLRMERHREKARFLFEEQPARMLEEQERQTRCFKEDIKREPEEERRQRERKKKTITFEMTNDYYADPLPRRDDRRVLERDRSAKRKPVRGLGGRFSGDYTPSVKRRRGGEVGLANVLETILDTLKTNEVSYLFLKPVTRKEAPDYLRIIEHPMDLATMTEKVKRFEYRNRDAFWDDMRQIAFNAHKYNDGRNPGIPPLADELLKLCDFLLSEYDQPLTQYEDDIED